MTQAKAITTDDITLQRQPIVGVLSALATTFLILSLASYDPADIDGVGNSLANLCGGLGASIAHLLIRSSGLAAWFWILVGIGLSIWTLRPVAHGLIGRRICGIALIGLALPAIIHLYPIAPTNDLLLYWRHVELGGLGGDIGWFLIGGPGSGGGILTAIASKAGAALILLGILVGGIHLLHLQMVANVRNAAAAWRRARKAYAERVAEKHRLPPRRERDSTGSSTAPGAGSSGQLRSLTNQPGSSTSASFRAVDPGEVSKVGQRLKERESTAELGEAQSLVDRIRKQRELAARSETPLPEEPVSEPPTPAPSLRQAEAPSIPPTPAVPADAPAVSPTVKPSLKAEPKPEPSLSGKDFRPLPSTDGGNSDEPLADEGDAAPAKPKRTTRKPRQRGESTYALPSARILDDMPETDKSGAAEEVERTARFIEEIFSQYKVNVKVVNATRGPSITQYELELLDAGLRVNKVAGLEQELSLNLGTEGIRIVAPLPNKTTIGVEVPNQIKEAVVMRDLVEECDTEKLALPLILGRDVIGNTMYGDLNKMPHLLVAGATGMGKSVCLNAIICSILLFRDPDEVKFIMVDPKMVELDPYNGIPHLLTPPITDMTKAHAALEWACTVMDQRYYALRLAGVRDIASYNKLGEKELAARLAKKGKDIEALDGVDVKMPYIIIVVDEYADLMMVNKDVEKSIVRLTAKSRACGIHIILTTQRPSADVVTGLIKSNLPSRICFRVADRNNSRVVLDAAGAENLLGKGDMLYLPPGVSSLTRGQGVWVKDHEIDAIIEHTKEQGEAEYDENIFKVGAAAMGGGGASGSDKGSAWLGDRKFHEAVQAMYRYNRTGADFLRRKMAIGYNKATQYIEWLEDLGFLSESKGTKPREFLKSWQDWLDELKINDVKWEDDDEIYHDPFA